MDDTDRDPESEVSNEEHNLPESPSSLTEPESRSESETEFDMLYRDVFCNEKLRRFALTAMPIDDNFANTTQQAIEELVPEEGLEKFFPRLVISYSTGNRMDLDAENAGPDYIVVACFIRFLFSRGMPCYSDMMTPSGWDWTQNFMNRIDEADAIIVVLTTRFFWSVPCLEEVYRAKKRGLDIIPLRLQEHPTEEQTMWKSKDLETYAKQNYPFSWSHELKVLENKRIVAIEALNVSTIPSRGSFLTYPNALGILLRRLKKLRHRNSPKKYSLGLTGATATVEAREIVHAPLRAVTYQFTNEVDIDKNEKVKCIVNRLLMTLQEFLQSDESKPTTITVEPVKRNGQAVKLVKFDVGFMMRELKAPRSRGEKAKRLLCRLAKKVGAEGEIGLCRIMAIYEGSLIIMMEAPSSFFSKMRHVLEGSGNHIVLDRDARVTGIAQAFVVTVPVELWPNDLEKARSVSSHEVVLIKKPNFSLLVPATDQAFEKLMSGCVNCLSDATDERWNSLPTVVCQSEELKATEKIPSFRPSSTATQQSVSIGVRGELITPAQLVVERCGTGESTHRKTKKKRRRQQEAGSQQVASIRRHQNRAGPSQATLMDYISSALASSQLAEAPLATATTDEDEVLTSPQEGVDGPGLEDGYRLPSTIAPFAPAGMARPISVTFRGFPNVQSRLRWEDGPSSLVRQGATAAADAVDTASIHAMQDNN